MSVSYCAYTIIGIEIFPDNFLETKRKKGCEHDFRRKDGFAGSDFCSECGAPAWIGEDKYKKDITKKEFSGDEMFRDKWKVVDIGNSMNPRKFIGWYLRVDEEDWQEYAEDIPDIEKIKRELKETLEPFGQWDEKMFGLWTGLYVSY